MTRSSRRVATLVLSAAVNTMPHEATISDSTRNEVEQAFAQLGLALVAFGPFRLGSEMAFVQAGIRVGIVDASKRQNADFDNAEFEAFVQRAHDVCAEALAESSDGPKPFVVDATEFAVSEGRDVDAVAALLGSIVVHPGVSIISADGGVVDVGVAKPIAHKRTPYIDVEATRITCIARIKTTDGQYDVPAARAEGLQVGDRIHLDGVEPPTGATCIRADRVDVAADPSDQLFEDSGSAETDRDPDDAK